MKMTQIEIPTFVYKILLGMIIIIGSLNILEGFIWIIEHMIKLSK